ncbi:YcxB family protein [Flavobacterium amniphilum]|uniref:YcxB family protein n=1 Tax=Flavobacterium amniphilum TaxID=1834035 RepID=UPI00202A2A19|nr:YcxB family protein [Flavobacterium amniphilum]MCL9806543.1 YcxB family protein [Flavobacterium amniphilum]
MVLEYSLDENDYLTHQLYTASKSKRTKKQRRKSWIIVSSLFFILGLLFLKEENNFLSYYFFGFGIITLIFYPFYLRNHYKKHYQKFITDTYKSRFGEIAKVNFHEEYLQTSDSNSESKINYTALEEINEIGDYIFLKLTSGGSLIIPKAKVDTIEEVKEEIKKISRKYGLAENIELNWKWK